MVFDAIADPFAPGAREWFVVQPGEQRPTVLSQARPTLVVWSSIWLDQPDLRIRFDIVEAGPGCYVRWMILGPEGELDPQDLRQRRYRINQLINGELRDTFDQ